MGKHIVPARKSEAGFTLVELAIVMIIIGLLIGGVLKGQELIANAQVAATISQIKGFDAATSTFRDVYDGMPGDIAGARIPTCGTFAACAPTASNNNGRVESPFNAGPSAEGRAFWLQLSAADLIAGINANGGQVFGGELPASEFGGGYYVSFVTGAATQWPGLIGTLAPRGGHYIAMHNSVPTATVAAGNVQLTPSQAFRIDRKMDDGAADTGIVRGIGTTGGGAADCSIAATGAYNEDDAGVSCGLYIRFQQ